MSRYVAAYDIAHHGRRRRVARVLQHYGRRVQRSVFEIRLEPAELTTLKLKLGPLLRKEDHFDLYPIDMRNPERRLRWARPPYRTQAVVLL